MANLVEFLVKIRDLASGQMRQLATNADGAFSRISSRMNRIGMSADQLSARIDQLTRTRDISLDTRQIRRANREIADLERQRDRITNPSGGGGGIGLFGKSLLLGGFTAAVALGGNALKKGMDRQMAGTSFEVMAGNKQGDKLHNNLMGFANDTIYGNEVFGEAKTMLGFGIAAKDIMPDLKMLGDVAMGDAEKMKSLSLVFSQTSSAGKLTGQDLLQYINAGFNPLQAISEKTGRKMADLRKDVEKSKITFQDVAGAFQYATGPMGRFHDGMKRMGETPTGKILAFQGAMETLAGTIGMGLLPVAAGMIDVLNWLGNNQGLMYGIAAGIGAMTIAWGLYTVWTQRAAIWQGILNAIAFWPIAVIGLLVGAVVWLVKSYDGWGKSVKALWQIITSFFSIVGVAFKENFQQWLYYFDLFYLKAKSVFQFVGQLISNTVEAMKLALSGDFTGAKKVLTAHITTDADKQIDALKRERSAQRAENLKAAANSMQSIANSWKQVGLTKRKDAGQKQSSWMDSLSGGTAGAGGGGVPAGVADSAKGIAGGGVRNQTINIAKLGIDELTLHAASVTEGAAEIRAIFIQMFNQVINSGNAAVNPN
ncbi:tape measure protein [Mucilaginibacter kameinonensis]|uniref:tape measure protein n=1 Tax=Mucilaginibacter kameinonensis TaxID=452286 RepID=UPI000EF77245|nr:tape measure protein [Mucilaginibacter kameinonensis]